MRVTKLWRPTSWWDKTSTIRFKGSERTLNYSSRIWWACMGAKSPGRIGIRDHGHVTFTRKEWQVRASTSPERRMGQAWSGFRTKVVSFKDWLGRRGSWFFDTGMISESTWSPAGLTRCGAHGKGIKHYYTKAISVSRSHLPQPLIKILFVYLVRMQVSCW